MANYYADRIRIGNERNLGNEVTRETPQKVDLGLGVKKALLCSVKAQEYNELFRFFFRLLLLLFLLLSKLLLWLYDLRRNED